MYEISLSMTRKSAAAIETLSTASLLHNCRNKLCHKSTQARRQKMKWGCFFVKSGHFLNAGCIMYSISIFYFTFYSFGACVRTQRTPLPTGLLHQVTYELEGYSWPTCSKQPRRVSRAVAEACRQEARPSTSFVDNTIDLPAKFSKFRVWCNVPEGSILAYGDTQISLKHGVE